MNPVLLQAIVEIVLFLNLSGEDAIQLDVAVNVLEQLSATLEGLDARDRETFADYVKGMIAEYNGQNARYIDTLRALEEDLRRQI